MSRKKDKQSQGTRPMNGPYVSWVDAPTGLSFCISRPVTVALLEQICEVKVAEDSLYRKRPDISRQMNDDPIYIGSLCKR